MDSMGEFICLFFHMLGYRLRYMDEIDGIYR